MFISFLGLGQAGGNVADLAAERGFYTGAINYSQKDLDSLENVEMKLKLVGSEGVGKNRQNAISLMSNNWDLATNFVKENFSHPSIEIIFVPFSTAGGSGSGLAPILLNMLQDLMPEKTFVAMPILPDTSEVVANQKNALDTFEDLSQLNICILPIDNDKAQSNSSNLGKSRLYNTVNNQVVSIIQSILSYTDQHSKHGVIDRKDLLAIFKTRGMATIAHADLVNLNHPYDFTESSLIDKVHDSWNATPFANIQYDQIVSAGIIFDGQESLMEYINMGNIFSKFNNLMPIHLYEGYYNNQNGTVISLLSGLNWITNRLEQMDNIIESNQEKIHAIYNQNHQGYKSKTTDLFNQQSQPKKQSKVNDISSLINKFKR